MMISLRRTAAEVLAAALYETFPGVDLICGGATPSGFYYDFVFPHPIHPELHLQIEEKMKQIGKEKREISSFEMVALSAKGFLESKGHRLLSKQIEGAGLFSLIQIGSFVDLVSEEGFLENTSSVQHIKIFPPTQLDGKQIRITGTVGETKEELKLFLKKRREYPDKEHLKRGEQKKYWKSVLGQFVWLSSGLRRKEEIISLYRKNMPPFSLEISALQNRSEIEKELLKEIPVLFQTSFIESSVDPIEEVGFFDPPFSEVIQVTALVGQENSLLQSIRKTLTMLGLNYSISLTPWKRREGCLARALRELNWPFEVVKGASDGENLDFLVEDRLGRQWSAVSIVAKDIVRCNIMVERNLSLLLELL